MKVTDKTNARVSESRSERQAISSHTNVTTEKPLSPLNQQQDQHDASGPSAFTMPAERNREQTLDRPSTPIPRHVASPGPAPLPHANAPAAYAQLHLSYQATYAHDPDVDQRIETANRIKEEGNIQQAVKMYREVLTDLAPPIDWRQPSPHKLQQDIEAAIKGSHDPNNAGEALLELGLALQQTDTPQAITIFTALEAQRDSLFSTSRPAPAYNRACCYLGSEQEPPRSQLHQGMTDLVDSLIQTILLRDKEDLKATHELLPRTNGSLWRLHAAHKPWIENVIRVMQGADAEGQYDSGDIHAQLLALRSALTLPPT